MPLLLKRILVWIWLRHTKWWSLRFIVMVVDSAEWQIMHLWVVLTIITLSCFLKHWIKFHVGCLVIISSITLSTTCLFLFRLNLLTNGSLYDVFIIDQFLVRATRLWVLLHFSSSVVHSALLRSEIAREIQSIRVERDPSLLLLQVFSLA